jgi:2,3-bisphosphoglycerate-dependent phosphoglycerate mutase
VHVVAPGHSLRALVTHHDGMSNAAIVGLNIPTGVPLVYDLDDALRPTGHRNLGDPDAVRRAAEAVAKQGAAKP